MLEINWNPSRRELRQFAAIWLPAFAALVGAVVLYRGGPPTTVAIIWAVAGTIAAIGLASPAHVRPLFLAWMIAAYPIGWTVSHVVLGLTYYGMFTLVGLLMRVFRYDPLARRIDRSATTYWTARRGRSEAAAYFRQF